MKKLDCEKCENLEMDKTCKKEPCINFSQYKNTKEEVYDICLKY